VLDKAYRSFLDSVGINVGLALTSAHCYETERRRADALAVAGEAKVARLHSVSREFRTPLRLLPRRKPLPSARNARICIPPSVLDFACPGWSTRCC
jgi:hypothetical protein